MKKLILTIALLFGLICSSQENYFTVYNFTVEPQNIATVFNLFDDYFTENQPEGVSVSLYENHFNDKGNNFTHAVVFSGDLDALGAIYSAGNNDKWNLFLTKVNQQVKEGFSALSGRILANHGTSDEPHPFQRYYILNVDDMSKFEDAHNNYIENHLPNGMTHSMGNISLGHGPDGANAWIITRFKDFKSAIGGAYSLRTEAEREASQTAWQERGANTGEVSLVRSGLRILLKSW